MLGFIPSESVVVLGVKGNRVEFCARMDLDHVHSDTATIAAQVDNACSGLPGVELYVLGYSTDQDTAAATMAPLIDAIETIVVECIAVTPSHWWYVIGATTVGQASSYDGRGSTVSLQALAADQPILQDRDAAVVAVQGPKKSDTNYGELIEQSARAAAVVAGMTGQDQAAAAVELASSETALTKDQSVQLAALMNTEDGAGAVLDTLTTTTAETYRVRLIEARSMTPATRASGVLAVLGMACWLDNQGAEVADCLVQLDAFDPSNPIGVILRSIHTNAIPPSKW